MGGAEKKRGASVGPGSASSSPPTLQQLVLTGQHPSDAINKRLTGEPDTAFNTSKARRTLLS